MSSQIHVGDVGTAFQFQCLDQSGAVVNVATGSTQIVFLRPDQTTVTKAGILLTDGTDGWVQYVSAVGDLSQAGTWHVQVYVTIGATLFHSDNTSFRIFPNIL